MFVVHGKLLIGLFLNGNSCFCWCYNLASKRQLFEWKVFFFFCCCYAMLLWLKLTFVFIDFGDLVLGSVSKFEFAKDVWLEFIFLVEFWFICRVGTIKKKTIREASHLLLITLGIKYGLSLPLLTFSQYVISLPFYMWF